MNQKYQGLQGRRGRRPCWHFEPKSSNFLRVSEITLLPMHKALPVSSPDFQTCRIADPPNRPGVKRRSRWVWKPVLPQAGREILLTTLACLYWFPAIGKSRQTDGKLATRMAHPSKDCAFRMDRRASCITRLNPCRAGRASSRLE